MKIPVIPRTRNRMTRDTGAGVLSVNVNTQAFTAQGQGLMRAGQALERMGANWLDKEIQIRNQTEINKANSQIIEAQARAKEAAKNGATPAHSEKIYNQIMDASEVNIKTNTLTNRATRGLFANNMNLTRARDVVSVKDSARIRMSQEHEASVVEILDRYKNSDLTSGQEYEQKLLEGFEAIDGYGEAQGIPADEIMRLKVNFRNELTQKRKATIESQLTVAILDNPPSMGRKLVKGLGISRDPDLYGETEWNELVSQLNSLVDGQQKRYDIDKKAEIQIYFAEVAQGEYQSAISALREFDGWGEISDSAKALLIVKRDNIIENREEKNTREYLAAQNAINAKRLKGFQPTSDEIAHVQKLASNNPTDPDIVNALSVSEVITDTIDQVQQTSSPTLNLMEIDARNQANKDGATNEEIARHKVITEKLRLQSQGLKEDARQYGANEGVVNQQLNYQSGDVLNENKKIIEQAIEDNQTLEKTYEQNLPFFTKQNKAILKAEFNSLGYVEKGEFLEKISQVAGVVAPLIFTELFDDDLSIAHLGALKDKDTRNLALLGQDRMANEKRLEYTLENKNRVLKQFEALEDLPPAYKAAILKVADQLYFAQTTSADEFEEQKYIDSINQAIGENKISAFNGRQIILPDDMDVQFLYSWTKDATSEDWAKLSPEGFPAANGDGELTKEQLEKAQLVNYQGDTFFRVQINGQNVLDNQGNPFLIALDRSKMGLVTGRNEDLSMYEPYQASRRDVSTLEEEGIMPNQRVFE